MFFFNLCSVSNCSLLQSRLMYISELYVYLWILFNSSLNQSGQMFNSIFCSLKQSSQVFQLLYISLIQSGQMSNSIFFSLIQNGQVYRILGRVSLNLLLLTGNHFFSFKLIFAKIETVICVFI